MNFIIDPKMVDYSMFAEHPNLHMVAKDKEQWVNLLYLILTEIEVRKEFYSKAFKRSPTNLEEYNQFRSESSRSDLPDFKRFIIWIDEYHILNKQDSGMGIEIEREALSYIARMGRAFCIHLICSSQSYNDFDTDVKYQSSTVFNFYTSSAYLPDNISNQVLETRRDEASHYFSFRIQSLLRSNQEPKSQQVSR